MFSGWRNYILFFFDHGLIVMICFFLFLFFAILSEKGQLAEYLVGRDARSKLSRYLSIRTSMIRESALYVGLFGPRMRKIAGSYGTTSQDILLWLGCIIKKLLKAHTALRVQYARGILVDFVTRATRSETRSYFLVLYSVAVCVTHNGQVSAPN